MIFQNILCHKCHLSKNRKTWMRLRGRLVNLQLNKKYSDFTKVFYLYFQNSKSQRANKSNWKNRRLTFNRSNFSRRVTSGTLGAFRRIYFVTIIADGTDVTRSIVFEVSLHTLILKKKRELNKPHHNDNNYLNYWGLSNVIISIYPRYPIIKWSPLQWVKCNILRKQTCLSSQMTLAFWRFVFAYRNGHYFIDRTT